MQTTGASPWLLRLVRRRRGAGAVLLALATAQLAGCATQTAYRAHHGPSFASPGRYYPPPGPASDPWGPYVREAASRFAIPERWIREVMRQESGGQAEVVSVAGAMGLMQVMPETYETLRQQYALGDDPFDPHNNLLAGAAYIREMYDRYGSPGFLAAYNAGPNRLDQYLSGSQSLPDETVNYLASVAPRLGQSPAMTGPLAAYAMTPGATPYVTASTNSTGCDPDAAYDPTQPCRPAAAPQPVAASPVAASYLPSGPCDPDAAYDPSAGCPPAPPAARGQSVLYFPRAAPPSRSPFTMQTASAAELPAGAWAIQVGAFVNPGLARAVADSARDAAPDILRAAPVALPTTAPFGSTVLYRARLTALSAGAAVSACDRLAQRQLPCLVVPPGQ